VIEENWCCHKIRIKGGEKKESKKQQKECPKKYQITIPNNKHIFFFLKKERF
jgi:hypothetical protein